MILVSRTTALTSNHLEPLSQGEKKDLQTIMPGNTQLSYPRDRPQGERKKFNLQLGGKYEIMLLE